MNVKKLPGRGFRDLRFVLRSTITGGAALLVVAGLTWAAKYTYTPVFSSSDQWSTGTDWDNAPMSASTTELTFVGANTTVLADSLVNVSNNDLGTFSLNILDLQGTGPATTAASVGISGFSGPLNFVSNGATTPVMNLNALSGTAGLAYNVFAQVTVANNLTIQGNGTSSFNFDGNFTVSGAATLTKKGSSNITFENSVTFGSGNVQFNGGGTTFNEDVSFGSGIVQFNAGTATFTGSSSFTSTGKIQIGVSGAAVVTYSGTATSTVNANNYFGVGDSAQGTLNITNGALNITATNGFFVGNEVTGLCDVSGGVLTVANANIAYIGGIPNFGSANGNGTLTVEGMGEVVLGGTAALQFGTFNAGATGTINIGTGNGTGTLVTSRTFSKNLGKGFVDFNGGVLQANAGISNATWITGLTGVFVKSGGGTIDTNGQNMGIPEAILTDPVSLGGGLTKAGAGTLTLSGANTYTGLTNVSAGTLVISGSLVGNVNVASSATLAGGANLTSAVGGVSVVSDANGGGSLLPGGIGAAGELTLTGDLNLGTSSTAGVAHLAMELGGTTPGSLYDQVTNSGAVNLGNVDLDGSFLSGFGSGITGDTFFLIVNDGGSAVSGGFANQGPQDGNGFNTISFGGDQFEISYTANFNGGTNSTFTGGHDVALLAVVPEPGSAAMLGVGFLIGAFRRRRSGQKRFRLITK